MARGGGRRVSSPSGNGTEENMSLNSNRSGREVVVELREEEVSDRRGSSRGKLT